MGLQPQHVSPGALDQQAPEVLVATLADRPQVGPATSAVLIGYQADGSGEASTAAELFAITHFDSQLASQLFIQLRDLLIQIAEVCIQPLQ